jgi:hypothetical protein
MGWDRETYGRETHDSCEGNYKASNDYCGDVQRNHHERNYNLFNAMAPV